MVSPFINYVLLLKLKKIWHNEVLNAALLFTFKPIKYKLCVLQIFW